MNPPTHHGTGTYYNPQLMRWEAWAVNRVTGKEYLLGWLVVEVDEACPDARPYWEQQVWLNLLDLIGAPRKEWHGHSLFH